MAKAPSTVALLTESQSSFTLVPQAPESCPTTWPLALHTGEPLLPPSVAPSVSVLYIHFPRGLSIHLKLYF
ncbi:MAG: hypothetical protein NT166_13450 [Candidatus Aminicenantes bacterium]|nr:hypothetical protein [Candidatus Aminicenantes bacterium]